MRYSMTLSLLAGMFGIFGAGLVSAESGLSGMRMAIDQCGEMSRQQKVQRAKNFRLFSAVTAGDVELVVSLIEDGADVDARDHQQRTPLILAAIGNQVEVVRVLLENNADMTATDYQGWDAMTHAVKLDHEEVIFLLMEKATSGGLCDSLSDETSEATKALCKKLK